MPLFELIGIPTSEQETLGNEQIQRFERGVLTWSQEKGFAIRLTSGDGAR